MDQSTEPQHAGEHDHGTWAGRVEDDALLRGLGRYSDDTRPDRAAFSAFVRSPHAHARIGNVDAEAARSVRGVLAVLTAADLAEADYATVSHAIPIPGRDGKLTFSPHRPALAGDRVMYVGQPVALVVAETATAAADGAEAVAVDYETLSPIVDADEAANIGAPQLWPDAPGNLSLDWAAPPDPDGKNKAKIDRIFADAAHVARIDVVNQRIVCASIEPRVATASYDPSRDRYTLRCASQGVTQIRGQVIAAMKLPPEKLLVLTEDVGGGFGMKASGYPEYVALLHAARQIARPVHWVSTRAEAFLSDNHGRDSNWHAELALNRRGRFLALRVEGMANVGAFLTLVAHFCSTTHVTGCLPSVYDIPRASFRSRLLMTNTVPIGPYRGAGRPEANYLLERLIDAASRVSGIDAAELRRRNLIANDKFPYKTPFGSVYDSGDFPGMFEKAMAAADYAGFKERRKQSKRNGKLRGIGVGCFLEIAGAWPDEETAFSFPGDGTMNVSIGCTPQGQGHRTVFRRVAAQQLGIDENSVNVTHGDSERDVPGFGAVASRSAYMISGAIARTAEEMIAKGRTIAAMLLQANEDAIEYGDGQFRVGKDGQAMSLFEVADRARELVRQGELREDLNTRGKATQPHTFPNGCHVAEVEIDPDTGSVEVVRYTAVDDCGNVLDHVIAEGQVHGGIAQGLGQALTEGTVYDASGQLLTCSFQDYGMPHADQMPDIVAAHHTVPCRTNPLGVKGVGEAGTTAAPCAIMNAIANALPEDAADSIDMPATPERIWRALQSAG